MFFGSFFFVVANTLREKLCTYLGIYLVYNMNYGMRMFTDYAYVQIQSPMSGYFVIYYYTTYILYFQEKRCVYYTKSLLHLQVISMPGITVRLAEHII